MCDTDTADAESSDASTAYVQNTVTSLCFTDMMSVCSDLGIPPMIND